MKPKLQQIQDFQTQFGQQICIPFDFSTGAFRIQTENYDHDFCHRIRDDLGLSAATRIAAYNGQYWFRLLSILQEDYPLCAQVIGLWQFNQMASEFLDKRPSTDYQFNQLSEGFFDYWSAKNSDPMLEQALRIDRAYRQVFLSAKPQAWIGQGENTDRGLCWNDNIHCLAQNWELIQARQTLDSNNEKPISSPNPCEEYWIVFRLDLHIHSKQIDKEFFHLLQSLKQGISLDQSLEELQLQFPDSNLESKVGEWFQFGMRYQWWWDWNNPMH